MLSRNLLFLISYGRQCEVCSALAVPWTNIIKCYNCIPLTYVLSYSEKHELLNVCYSQSYES